NCLLKYAVSLPRSKVLILKDRELEAFDSRRADYFDGESGKTQERNLLLLRTVVLFDFPDDHPEVVRPHQGLRRDDKYEEKNESSETDLPSSHCEALLRLTGHILADVSMHSELRRREYERRRKVWLPCDPVGGLAGAPGAIRLRHQFQAPKITTRCDPNFLLEHSDKGACAAVARFKRHAGHGLAARQELQGVNQPQPLSPLAERQPGLRAKKSFNGS